jgi:hypothetical protein
MTISFNIPRHYYRAALKPDEPTDHIVIEVVPPTGTKLGIARLGISATSPGKKHAKPTGHGKMSLTEVEVSMTLPRCTIGLASAKPKPSGLVMTPAQTASWCTWRHHRCRKGQDTLYEVPFRANESGLMRFEFRVRAAELARMVRLRYDVQVTAQLSPEQISVPTSQPVEVKPAGKSAEASG